MRGIVRWLCLAVTAPLLFGIACVAGATNGAGAGAVAHSDPGTNLALPSCSSYTTSNYDDSQACVEVYLAAIDAARAAEGVGPMNLPANWFSLTPAEQTFDVTNLERVDRGLSPVEGLVASLDNDAQAGAQSNQDPAYGGSLGTYSFMATIWSWTENGEANPLVSDFYWMYDDGPSWVHRNGILDAACTDANGSYCVAGTGAAFTGDGSCTGACTGLSASELFISAAGTPPPLAFTSGQELDEHDGLCRCARGGDAGLLPGRIGRRDLRSGQRPVRGIGRFRPLESAHRRHGGHARRRGLLAGRFGRRHLQLRRRPLLRVHRRDAPERADRWHGGDARWRWLLAGGLRRRDLQLWRRPLLRVHRRDAPERADRRHGGDARRRLLACRL